MSPTDSAFALLRQQWISRIVTAVLVVSLNLLGITPLAAAWHDDPEAQLQSETASEFGATEPDATRGQVLAQALKNTRALLRSADTDLRRGLTIAEQRQELGLQRHAMQPLHQEVLEEFAVVESWLRERQVPQSILDRHQQTVAAYRGEMQALLDDLDLIDATDAPMDLAMPIERAERRLSERALERAQRPFDPTQRLPHHAQEPRPENLPRLYREEFIEAGLLDTPLLQLAALESYRLDGLPGALDTAYRAPGVEVSLSPEIHAQAEALGHDPVAIYHWVRHQVEWLPTWGAVQSADLTLSARQGNAMDIASLLTALLRAAGIPARYVHGTIDVPQAAFRNWVGGFEHLESAMNYAASGGIPVTGLIEGGQITQVRLEHVWVEAAIDYLPSQGAVLHAADTWLALDASFKQYEYVPGLDAATIAGIDTTQLGQDFLASGSQNLHEGWIQGLDASIVEAGQEQAREALEAHIAQAEDLPVEEIIGGRRTIVREAPILPSGLPYERVVEGARYAALPQSLQPRIRFGIGADLLGNPLEQIDFPWAELNNRKVTLSFLPATPDDEAALLALLPEGELTDVSQLPSSIPAYLIRVVPQLKIEGETVLTGASLGLGEELAFSYSVRDPIHGTQHYPNRVLAGSHLSVAVIGGGVAIDSLRETTDRIRTTRDLLAAADPESLAEVTREAFLGDLFHAGLLSYFAQFDALARLVALSQDSHFQVTTSVGTYGYVPRVTYLFGIPRNLHPAGVVMDLDRVAMMSSTDSVGYEGRAAFNFQVGIIASALEHLVPEQMFVTEAAPGEAVSAVRALQKAAAQGQRIYHITPATQAEALLHIRQNALTMNEVRSALAAGREVIIHTDPVEVPGWRGAGYVLFDPDTGAGAWKIAGGANGGSLELPKYSLEFFWSALNERGGPMGKFLSKTNTVLTHSLNIFDIVKSCPTGIAIGAIISITLVFSGFFAVGFAVAVFGAVAMVGYGMATTVAVAAVSAGWRRSCDQ